jgi:hypothetical protein
VLPDDLTITRPICAWMLEQNIERGSECVDGSCALIAVMLGLLGRPGTARCLSSMETVTV